MNRSHGATGWSSALRKMENPEEPLTSNPSTPIRPGRPTTPNRHFTKPGRSHRTRRRQCLTLGMATTVSHFTPTTDTTRPSSPPGAGTGIVQPLKVISPLGTDTLGGMTKSHPPSQTKQSALTTPSYGQTPLKAATSKLLTGLTYADGMELPSTQTNFNLPWTKLNLRGSKITSDTVCPCRKYMRAISDFPTPQNITDVRSWFGLVNQVSYTLSMADQMLPFRDLLKPSTKFHWNDQLQTAFDQSKVTITNEIARGVSIFDKSKPTCLATDWSKQGIGYWLFQKHCSCPSNDLFCCKRGWQITLVGSTQPNPDMHP